MKKKVTQKKIPAKKKRVTKKLNEVEKVGKLEPIVESFNTIITRCGNSGHISVSKSKVGKAFEICMNKIFDKKLVEEMQKDSIKRKRL